MNSDHRPGFWRSFGQGACIVLAAAGLTYGLHRGGFFERWENNNLDRWLLAKQTSKMVDEIVLVVIDDADYLNDFHKTSPLHAERIVDVLESISKGNPKLIGVDLDTSDWIKKDVERAAKIPNVVWARDGWEDRAGTLRMEKLLGEFYEQNTTCFGLPAVEVDDDGVVRRYARSYRVSELTIPAFPSVLAGKEPCPNGAGAAKSETEPGEGGIRINFRGPGLAFRRLTSSAIVTLAKTEAWKAGSDVDGRIVLLGGVFRAARDRYPTPIGMLDGVTIVAHIVQAERCTLLAEGTPGCEDSKPITEAGHAIQVLVDIGLGLLLVAIFYFVPVWWKKLLILAATFSLAIFGSFWLLHSTAYFFSFVPVLGGVLLHEFIEAEVENKKLRDELSESHS
jgi:CHASE2 domain-containing sensor protein